MSLLDEARRIQKRRIGKERCVAAVEISKLDPELYEEVREMMADPDLSARTVTDVLEGAGPITIRSDTIGNKRRNGCKCQWCTEHKIWPTS